MSRDQKPGKFKLVGATAPNPGRRRDDKVAAPAPAAGSANAADPAAEVSRSGGLLPVILFLIASALGGAGAVFFGLVRGFAL